MTDNSVALAIVALWAVAWMLIDPIGNFPITDDWAYAFAVKSILETNQFRLTGFSAPNLIAQAYWGALFCLPFGFSFQALRLSTVVLALAGLFAAFKLFRELGADRGTAAVGALTLGANPLFLQLSVSFMTDVPFTAVTTIALWLYVRGAARDRPGLLVAAYLVAIVALFIRQFAFALPIAFAAAHLVRRGVRLRTLTVALLPILLFAGLHSLFQHWIVVTARAPRFAESVGELRHFSLAERLPIIRVYFLAMVPYFGLFCFPFLAYLVAGGRVFGRPGRPAGVFWAVTGILATGIVLVLWQRHDMLPTLGNGLAPFGLGPLILFDSYFKRINVPVVPGASEFWTVLTVAGAWGTAVLVVLMLRLVRDLAVQWRSPAAYWPQVMMLTFSGCYTGAILLASLLDQVFDRYLIALILPLCAFLFVMVRSNGLVRDRMVAIRPTPRSLVGLMPISLCLVVSIAMAHDFLAFHRARWQAIDGLEQQGIAPAAIDGGFEYGGVKLFEPNYQRRDGVSWWWIRDNQYVIGLGPMPGYQIIQTVAFQHWIPVADYSIHVLRRL